MIPAKNKMLILALILFIIATFIAVSFLFLKRKGKELSIGGYNAPISNDDTINEILSPAKCQSLGDGFEKNKCNNKLMALEAITKKDVKECLKIVDDNDFQSQCFLIIAENNKQVDICYDVKEEKTKNQCFEKLAVAVRNQDLCSKIVASKNDIKKCQDRTKSFVFSDNLQIDQCYNIETSKYANLCKFNVYNKISECLVLEEEFRKDCSDFKAMSSVELTNEKCDSIKNADYRNYCDLIVNLGYENASRVDSDSDGLNDGNELLMKLDPNNPDLDSDGLIDGDEVLKYRTDPANSDTDEDGYNDEEEVKNRYDPLGPGKLQ